MLVIDEDEQIGEFRQKCPSRKFSKHRETIGVREDEEHGKDEQEEGKPPEGDRDEIRGGRTDHEGAVDEIERDASLGETEAVALRVKGYVANGDDSMQRNGVA